MTVTMLSSQAPIEAAFDNVVLARLAAEVSHGLPLAAAGGYNRTYNRHNR